MKFPAGIVVVAAIALCACTPETQVTLYEQGKYKGKPDEVPWNNAPLSYGTGEWDQGDKQGWEMQLRKRVMAQNEAMRIEHR